MTLAYAILMPLMPEHEHGALTGFYSLSRGVGIITGPLIVGALIYATRYSRSAPPVATRPCGSCARQRR